MAKPKNDKQPSKQNLLRDPVAEEIRRKSLKLFDQIEKNGGFLCGQDNDKEESEEQDK